MLCAKKKVGLQLNCRAGGEDWAGLMDLDLCLPGRSYKDTNCVSFLRFVFGKRSKEDGSVPCRWILRLYLALEIITSDLAEVALCFGMDRTTLVAGSVVHGLLHMLEALPVVHISMVVGFGSVRCDFDLLKFAIAELPGYGVRL